MRRAARATVCAALAIAGCDTTPATRLYCPTANTRSIPADAASRSGFFPARLAAPTIACDGRCIPVINDIFDEWYAKQLTAAGEPPLFGQRDPSGRSTTLRFTWLRTFDRPVVMRLDRSEDTLTFVAKELSGMGGYEPGQVRRTVRRRWRGAAADRMERDLRIGALFSAAPSPCDRGWDGADWLFERVDRNGYRLATYWSPDEGPASHTGLALLRATGWRVDPVY